MDLYDVIVGKTMFWKQKCVYGKENNVIVEMLGIEPRAFHMQSERSTTELHPLLVMCSSC